MINAREEKFRRRREILRIAETVAANKTEFTTYDIRDEVNKSGIDMGVSNNRVNTVIANILKRAGGYERVIPGVYRNPNNRHSESTGEPMTDIDRKIAERVMDWTHKGTNYVTKSGFLVRKTDDWSPSTRIDHAWSVVEKMVGMHDDGDFHLEHLYNYWRVGFCQRETWFEDAPTAPLAICKAALAAVEES